MNLEIQEMRIIFSLRFFSSHCLLPQIGGNISYFCRFDRMPSVAHRHENRSKKLVSRLMRHGVFNAAGFQTDNIQQQKMSRIKSHFGLAMTKVPYTVHTHSTHFHGMPNIKSYRLRNAVITEMTHSKDYKSPTGNAMEIEGKTPEMMAEEAQREWKNRKKKCLNKKQLR